MPRLAALAARRPLATIRRYRDTKPRLDSFLSWDSPLCSTPQSDCKNDGFCKPNPSRPQANRSSSHHVLKSISVDCEMGIPLESLSLRHRSVAGSESLVLGLQQPAPSCNVAGLFCSL